MAWLSSPTARSSSSLSSSLPSSCSSCSSCPPPFPLAHLPAELRLKIWSCAVEPRIVILDDLVYKQRSYPIPPVTQLNAEARSESRHGYEAVIGGSYLNFSRDIVVCDCNLTDQKSNKPLEELAPRVQRLAFWDCFPDDGRVDGPSHYTDYLAASYPREHRGKIEFDRFWFPNLKELWIVKVGEVNRSWKIDVDESMPCEARARQTARQFRYWIDDDTVEMAPLDLDDPDTKAVLRQGRCGKTDCRELNHGRPKMVSKIVFMNGCRSVHDGAASPWKRIWPWPATPELDSGPEASRNRMRWIIVERIFTFSLRRWETTVEADDA
ncbi:hypothetical protein CDD81_3091 [Ophiocordyceps australis]|uniref:2EXR domain-containing protein n=1 Tax=Ophiocordyceps australis TaxID=1399860 RepID=A0A2C5YD78_9HYPO|nr:hypothetical protein CDD81_3091 [Ophiocordyceps australis]